MGTIFLYCLPNKLDTPDKCNEKIAKSTEPPEWDWIPARGG